jgi:shikimate dehydrogenase
MQHFAVIGNPIAHSKSPQIHAAFAQSCNIALQYTHQLADIDGFGACVADLRQRGFGGVNVTVPFKLDALEYADELSAFARFAGAVNTLQFTAGKAIGHNTDGVGLVRDLTVNLHQNLSGKRIALLGMGGAARGVLPALMLEKPAHITLINRTASKAIEMKEYMDVLRDEAFFVEMLGQPASTQFEARAWTIQNDDCVADANTKFDVIINATASGLSNYFVPPNALQLNPDALAYDMMYGKQTDFLSWAAQLGARTADGWGMLVEQAAESFHIWHGVRPDTQPLLERS